MMTDTKCKTCGGRGRWQEEKDSGNMVELVWRECNDCGGTGLSKDPQHIDDFDIGEEEKDD